MWPDASGTQELLDLVAGGDAAALDRLLARHRQALCRVVSCQLDRRIAQRIDASDIVQDVLIEATRRLQEYLRDPSLPFHIWLRRLARDHLIDAYRKHKRAAKRSVDRERRLEAPVYADRSSVELAAQLAAAGLTPATAAMHRELQERFTAALDELSDDDREIIIMRHVEQLTNQEAARSLGITEPAAGMRHLRALRRLRRHLGEE